MHVVELPLAYFVTVGFAVREKILPRRTMT
jgi:hypothetical protein